MASQLFVFMAISSRGLGGSYIYMNNKLRYYAKLGWDTLLIHANSYSVNDAIPGLSEFDNNYDLRLRMPPGYFSDATRKRVLSSLIERFYLRKYDKILIESSELYMALWAEMLAKELNAKHLVFLLSEHNAINSKSMFDFLEFKASRVELAGITKVSIPQLFNGWETTLNLKELVLPAYSSNCIDDVDYPLIDEIPKANHLISIIGRVRKPFIYQAINDVAQYIKSYPEKRFVLLIVGGSTDDKLYFSKFLKESFSTIENAQYFVTGPIYPIPLSLLKKPDVVISSAGACAAAAKLGKLVISYDANDLCPIGIYKVTTEHTIFRGPDEPALDLKALLDDILVNGRYHEFETDFDVEKENDIDFSSHDLFLEKSSQDKVYFDISKISLSIKDRLLSLPVKILGAKLGSDMLENYYRIRQKI